MREFEAGKVGGQAEVEALTRADRTTLDEVLRQGAQQLLITAVHDEVSQYIELHAREVDESGRRMVVRNGRAKQRSILTPMGEIGIQMPRVEDRRRNEEGKKLRFTSKILPPYLRRTKSVDELIPWLYLKGISTGDFTEALQALLGPGAAGLSANTVVRLKEQWCEEYEQWRKRDLSEQTYVYLWVDGIYCNVRLEGEKQCFLVIIGATAEGRKELLAVHDGVRESELSWKEVLLDLKNRGLTQAPKLAVGDGALGFWAALDKIFPTTRPQRCWVHKTANVLNKLPKSVQTQAKKKIHEIYMADHRKEADQAFETFTKLFEAKYPKAVECLEKDREALLAFYDFPAEHWKHIRTTNPIESTFATVRLRHRRTKGSGTQAASLAMVFMLARQAERHWRKLDGPEHMKHIVEGKEFKDGVLVQACAA